MNLHHQIASELVAERQHMLRNEARSAALVRLARLARRSRRANRRKSAERDVRWDGERHEPGRLISLPAEGPASADAPAAEPGGETEPARIAKPGEAAGRFGPEARAA